MDFSQEVSLSSIKNSAKNSITMASRGAMPSKTSINLMQMDGANANKRAQILAFVVAVILILIFAYFAVMQPLAKGFASDAEVAAARSELNAVQNENKAYDEVSAEYAQYVISGLNEDEATLASRDDMIDIINTKVLPLGDIRNVQVRGNVITAVVDNAALYSINSAVREIRTDERVLHATVETAQDGETTKTNSASTSATVQITLVPQEYTGSTTQDSTEDEEADTDE